MTTLDCLDCRQPLKDAWSDGPYYLRCACGVRYAIGLLGSVDVALWNRAKDERLFRRRGDNLTLTDPLEAILTRDDL